MMLLSPHCPALDSRSTAGEVRRLKLRRLATCATTPHSGDTALPCAAAAAHPVVANQGECTSDTYTCLGKPIESHVQQVPPGERANRHTIQGATRDVSILAPSTRPDRLPAMPYISNVNPLPATRKLPGWPQLHLRPSTLVHPTRRHHPQKNPNPTPP